MTDEIDEFYEIDIIDAMTDERLPSLIREWSKAFGQVSRHNEFAAILAYFNLLGSLLKDDVRIPFGFTMEDSRVHVCWIQTARSGKSVLNDFYTEIVKQTYKLVDINEEEPYHTVFDVVDTTDAGLIGTTEKVPNPLYVKDRDTNLYPEGEPKEISIPVLGSLEGSGLAMFDEFESSGIFKNFAHKENVVTYFQKLMNTLTTEGYLIKKKLAQGPEITCDCQRSVWGTTYPPEHLTEVIATKGVLQRMFMFVRDVPQHTLDVMRKELIYSIGTVKERSAPRNKFAKALHKIHYTVRERKDSGVAMHNIVTFAEGVPEIIETEYDNMRAYLSKLNDGVKKIVSLFETNSLMYITKLAVLCAITETPSRNENEQWVVFPRNVRQATWVVRQGYMSLVSWMITTLRTNRQSIVEKIGFDDYINAYHNCNDTDGWVNKANFRISLDDDYDIPQAKFYRNWPKIKNKFEEKKINKTVYIKLKDVEE